MTEVREQGAGPVFEEQDLTGARFRKVHLNEAVFRMVDLSGAVMREVSMSGASIDGEIDDLQVNGVQVAPLVEVELTRRVPARALRRSPNPDGLREAWSLLEQSWSASTRRVAAGADGTAHVREAGEWSYTETLRHLVFVTDAWLGAACGDERAFHPWGLAFTDLAQFVDGGAEALGLDTAAAPTWDEVLALRADRVAQVRDFLAGLSADQLAREVTGPAWERGERLTVLRCLWVILNEECEHLRFAERDLDQVKWG